MLFVNITSPCGGTVSLFFFIQKLLEEKKIFQAFLLQEAHSPFCGEGILLLLCKSISCPSLINFISLALQKKKKILEMGSHCVGQVSLELLSSRTPPASASLVARTTESPLHLMKNFNLLSSLYRSYNMYIPYMQAL